ncbi:mucin-2-like [Phyllobates terribilis]|uniref:mucin-2-like n=1 Tax=Phyllobates terribilis TaxID=111132 RepID=UPI003CCB66C1
MQYGTLGLWVLCFALGFSRAIDVIPGRIHNHGHYVCSTWGNYHFKTFDGFFYQFPGSCSYNLASHCGDSYQEFSVHIHRSLVNDHPFIDKITITIKDVTVQMKNNLLVLNGDIVKTPYYTFGILIHKNDDYYKIYTKVGLTLMWNKEDAVMLELDPSFKNHTCGLCGDYNGDPKNSEFLSEDNTFSSIHFGNQQNINDPNEECNDTEETQVTNPANCSKYRSECEEHLHQDAFSDCMKLLNLEPYVKACMIDMCSCDDSQDTFCLCSSITEYSRQCSHAGGRPGNWRTIDFCPKQCPANMIYQESASPCKNSCSHFETHKLCEEHYMDGCFCPEGTVHDDYTERGCVPVGECHCKHQGKLYSPGESVLNDCDKCHCVAGRWSCTDLPCPKVCSIEGGAHFTTFDGKTYSFHGNCLYVLLKGSRINFILGKLIPCGSSERETCLKSVILVTDSKNSVVQIKTGGIVSLNGLKVTLPYVTANFSILQPSAHYIIVQTAYGLQMQIQLLPKMQLYIRMEKTSKEQLQGLCGNFNTKEGDDFTASGGLVEATASVFANTWKSMANCHDISDWLDDPCSASIENKNYAEYWCSKLENMKSPFAKCHSTINPTEYVKRCYYDSCNCKDSEHCMCAALSSYVRACAAKGIILWGWKSGICDKYITSCPSNQIYLYNLTTYQPTCQSLAAGEKVFASVFTPIDGCGCPDGQYLDEKDQCVHISKCSCYHHDTYLKPQKIFNTQDRHCICQNGNLVCTDQVNKTCPGGKVYFDCNKRQSLLRRSCKTLSIDYFQTECISGCVCPNGLLDDGVGGCVPEDRCPCVHNKDIYPHGTQVEVDCKRCLCQRGRWTCTNTVCYGTCTIYGDGHYITFDNKIYDFDGNCEFVAAQDYCETDSSGGSFRVLTENIPCGTTGVTCSKSMTVFLGNTMLKLSEKHVLTTTQLGGERVDYLTREVGIYVVIEASNGILLIWDKKTTIFIKVSPAYKGKLCGLCGNFDENSQNDFKTRHMIQVVDVLEFGNSWKVDPSCPDATDILNPCSQNPHRRSWAEKQCGLIKSHVFTPCHCKVDPKPFYEACVSDACSCDSGGDCECFCTAVAAYAQECTKAEACVYWRTPDICPIFCDYYNPKDECEWHYHPCGNHDIQTCRSINNVYSNVTITYLEGCYPTCPKNRPIFDETNKKCVTREECGCYINNVHYKTGEEVPQYKECYECVCSSNGNIDCKKQEFKGTIHKNWSTDCIKLNTKPKTSFRCSCVHKEVCQWTQWLDISKPGDDLGSGDYETYDEIRNHHAFCDVPEDIECRATNAPDISLDDLNQVVHCNLSYGLICRNNEQKPDGNLWEMCFNYEIRVECCHRMCLGSTPISTTLQTTTIPETTTATLDTTTGSTTWSSPITSELTTPVKTQNCTPICSWSEWISASYPEYLNGGDDETYQNIRQAGYDICERPSYISCRAKHWPDRALHELGQKVTCDVSYGLICNNKEQNYNSVCYNYEIQVYCCTVPEMCLHTTPQISELTSSTPIITNATGAGTNTTTTWTSTKTTKFRETSSHPSRSTPITSTLVTTSPTTIFSKRLKRRREEDNEHHEHSDGSEHTMRPKYNILKPLQRQPPEHFLRVQILDLDQTCTLIKSDSFIPLIDYKLIDYLASDSGYPSDYGFRFLNLSLINETWMVKNCTMAKCLENHTVELIELKCEPPPTITCVNGKTPIAVPDDNQCCWHWQCDCECSGWGDPHYLTFDGTYYTFQGTCTYTLVEEIEKKNNLSIYIDNYNCGTKDLVSCPRNLIVHYNSQEIQLVVGVSESIKIQVVVNGEIVGTPYKKNGIKIYTKGINYVMEIPELEVNITFNGLSFSIKLPYDRFGHNTQGQCGTCTNNRSDDCRTRSGNIIPRCEIMADSWIIEDFRKPECSQNNTTAPPKMTTPFPTCQPSLLCDLIVGQTFQKCHKIVPPNHYYEACVYDSCRAAGAKIECSSLQHYAQLCGEKGICIDWRSQVPECSLPCFSPKVYNACGSTIQRTCETTQIEDLIMKDDERLVEGCFCPQDTVRFSPSVDVCVDTCGCVSPDNVPRKFGEKFQFGCQDCICREGGSGITCQKHMCKNITTVHCNLEGFFPEVKISPTDPCCQETVCKCNVSRCETKSPTCELGYEAVGSTPDGHCCIQYQCVAKNVCVQGNAEYMPGAQVYTDNCQSCVCTESANSTTRPSIQCTDILHNAQCPLGFALKKDTKHCCGGCEQTHCVLSLNGSSSSYRLIKPAEIIISENKCTEYRCSVINNQFITSSSHISCPDFNEDDCKTGTVKLLPNGCCKVCVKKTVSCKLYEYYDYLSYNNCRTADLVKISGCIGSCETFSTYSSSTKAMSHKCACCQEVQTRQKHVMLQCSDGSQVEHEYIALEKCDCVNTACEPKKANEEEMTLA